MSASDDVKLPKGGKWSEPKAILLAAMVIVILFYAVYKVITASFSSGSNVTEIYFADSITPVHKEIIADFNREYSGSIKVIPVDISFRNLTTNERKQIFTRSLRSENKRIDIFSIDQIWIPRFSKCGEPLDSYIDKDFKRSIVPAALKPAEYKGRLTALPQFADMGLLYYRDDLIDENGLAGSGASWSSLLGYMKAEDNKGLVFQGASYEGLMCMFTEIYLGLGGTYNYNSRSIYDKDTALAAVRFMHGLIYNSRVTPVQTASLVENSSYNYFINNDIILMRNWATIGKGLFSDSASLNKIKNVRITEMPYFEGGNAKTLSGGWYMMLSRLSENKEEAAEFMKFWLRKSSQQKMFEGEGFVPVNAEIYKDEELSGKYPRLKFYNSLFGKMVSRPLVPGYTRISDIMSKYINKVLKGELTPEEGNGIMFAEINDAGINLEEEN